MKESFSAIKACVFDAYGTLFDVHSAAALHARRLGDKEAAISELWRSKQLQYTWLRSLMRHYDDFWTVTSDALDYAMDTYGITDEKLREDLMNAYLRLECFEEVIEVLSALKDGGMVTAVLSNGSPAMLDPVVENSGVSQYLDACLSVDAVGVYKPDPAVYELACDRFGVEREQVAFMSSNCWDAVGAAEFGFKVAWVNRYGQRLDRLPAKPQAELSDLRGLPQLVGLT